MHLFRKIIGILIFLLAGIVSFGQNPPLDGEYVFKPRKGEGTWVLKLKPDSTYTWNFTQSKSMSAGRWKIINDEIILHDSGTQKEIHFKVISGDDSERAVLYYRKDFYFKKT
jgi:hypothetical protein